MPITESYDDYLIQALKNKDEAVGYLNAALDEDLRIFLLALRDVTLAQGGVGRLASRSGLNRESLYRMLSEKGNPSIGSLSALFGALAFVLRFPKGNNRGKRSRADR